MINDTEPRQPIFNVPGVIRIVAILTILIHLLQLVLSPMQNSELIRYFAFIPARFSLPDVWQFEGFSLALSPISYAFLHADGYHLLLNMFFLLAFGTAAARRVSWPVFLILYAVGAVISAFFWMAFNGDAITPLVGASGALSAAAGALVRMSIAPKLPHDPRYPIMPAKTAVLFGLFWIGMNLFFALTAVTVSFGIGNVAWEAHIGGFLFGFAVGRIIDGAGLGTPIARPPSSM
jgi:membrane associated rhomboid family serine protease